MKLLPLCQLKEGEKAEVFHIATSGSMRRRFLELGIMKGTIIECLYKSPFGDPIAFLIHGTVIALRSDDSKDIFICPHYINR